MSLQVEGVRVVRGPNWSHGDEDGGEGHVGTLTDDNEDNTVEVQWDMGKSGCYSAGKGRKFELRVLDSAPVGLKHTGIKCAECKSSEFSGTRWMCNSCKDVNVCTPCYFLCKHNTQHEFLRIDIPGMTGISVGKRGGSAKVKSYGMFKGAKVKRGRDWTSGDQDGGKANTGTVVDVCNYGTLGHERDAVKVVWPSNKTGNTYRVGYRGKVDLLCVNKSQGTAPVSQSRPVSARPGVRTISRRPTQQQEKPQLGDKVCVELPESALKEVQRGHGGWSMRMKEYIGQHGKIIRFEDNGDCVIDYDSKEWRFNADAVIKVPALKIGDIVRIVREGDKAQALQKQHGGWNDEMSQVLGKVGKVVKLDSDGDVAVAFGNKAWVFNPACCTPAPGEKIFEMTEGGKTPSGSGPGAAGPGKGSEDDEEVDEAAEALAHLIAQLFLGGQRGMTGPRDLVSSAAKNDHSRVDKILQDKPALKNEKDQGLTALIISSHEGHFDVVRVLLKHKVDLDIREGKGNTALMAALMKAREDIAMMLIEAGSDINLWNNFGRTPLHFAAANEANTILKELLSRGADPNRPDGAGNTALHDAVINKNNPGVELLLSAPNVNVKIVNQKGHSPLHVAAMKGDDLTVSRILEKHPELKDMSRAKDRFTALHVAAVNDNTDVIKTLLKVKVNVDARNVNQLTPLHLACNQGYVKASTLLIEASANVNALDETGDTPLHACVMGRRAGAPGAQLAALFGLRISSNSEINERINLACYLIKNGARVEIKNKRNKTAIECCPDERMRKTIKDFADKHAQPVASGDGAGGARALLNLLMNLPLPCITCAENVADTKFMPCGHRVCCVQCSFQTRDCPRCHAPIQERLDPGVMKKTEPHTVILYGKGPPAQEKEGRRLRLADSCRMQ